MNVDESLYLAPLISKAVDGIMEEVDNFVKSSHDPDAIKVQELLHYIIHEKASEKEYPNGTRDKGRAGYTLMTFLTDQSAQNAGLKAAELVALRLYTTLAYKYAVYLTVETAQGV